MFRQAVFRLTLWYLGAIMLLSVVFSVALYNVSTRELNALQTRQEAIVLPAAFAQLNQQRIEQIQESKRHIAVNLFYFNLIILAAGAGLGYLLAQHTLEPLEESLESQKRFTADASHELRTPLTAMRSELEVALRDKKLTLSDSKKLHQSILEEVGKLETLTNGLLTLSQHDQERNTLLKQPCSLEDIVQEAISRVEKLAKQRSITLTSKVKEAEVRGDRWSLVEAVSILLDNAVKYSPDKSEIKLVAARQANQAFIAVEDQGMGIAAADIPHLFDRFFRAEGSRNKQKASGYGLGLSIAQKIVRLHRGQIEVRSELGKGSAFIIRLPA